MTLRFEPTPTAKGTRLDLEALATRRRPVDPAMRPAFLAQGAAQANLERLFRRDTLCITTGQQPGLFTGPLFTIYKALTAVALARDAEARLGRPVVPVFWVAGDDHDFAEANHLFLLAASNDVQRVTLRERGASAPLTPLYREPVGSEIEQVFAAVMASTPETEFRPNVLAWLRRHYRPQSDLATAFSHAMAELLADQGLVIFQPTHAAAKRVMAPLLLRLLECAVELDQALADRARELEAAGSPAPVPVGDGTTTIMLEAAMGRDRLVLQGGSFATRRTGERWTAADLQRVARETPERLSPNVLARPAVEAALLPTLAYVAGPGELAYLPQAAPIYRALDAPPQAAVPRWSGRVIETRVAKVLDKFGITADALNRPEGQLEAELVRGEIPATAREALDALRLTIGREYDRLTEATLAIDPTLRKPVESTKHSGLASLTDIEKRLVSHLKQQNAILLSQLAKARNNLFPQGRPQERVLNVTPYLIRYGPAFVRDALAACEPHVNALATVSGRS